MLEDIKETRLANGLVVLSDRMAGVRSVTLGLFFFVVNALMLYLADILLSGLTVDGFGAALLGGIVIALFNWVVRAFSE